ncbi:cytochrome c oxidase assembly protein [Faunimonas sp. B44]|uniref:cytochrome c oxidase assembly protein n=1 Tax=Faunimonas sp. B44 TaxID=3461493 RepID=UPI004043B687
MNAVAYCGPAPVPHDILATWNFDPVLLAAMAAMLAGHLVAIRRRSADPNARRGPAALAWILLAILFISPLCALSSALFSARVLHHVVLTAVVAPLIVMSLPALAKTADAARGRLTLVFLGHTAILWLWHLPQPYAAALSSDLLYWVMQVSLLGSALLLWGCLLRDGPMLPRMTVALGSIIQMGLLGALITFARAPLYAAHAGVTEPWGLTQMEDQQLAGLIMWVPAALPYLAAALVLVGRTLSTASVSQTGRV